MQRSSKKTWSQQTLAVERQIAGFEESGFFTREKRAMILLAVKTALAAGLCYWLATLVHLQDGYWGSISAIIVLQSNVGSTVTASRDRLIGTLVGAGYGAVFALIDPGKWLLGTYLLAVIASMVSCGLMGLKNSSRLAGVTVTIILLVHRTGSNWTLPMHRVLEVLLGIIVALAFSTLVIPSRARLRLRDGLAQEYLLIGALFDACMTGLNGNPAGHLVRLQKDVEAARIANAQLLDAARNEPSAGPASLESLSILHQFGKQMEDAIKALALALQSPPASEDSSAASYAAHLEPELGKLAADIHLGLQFVAGCIHRWQFPRTPEGLDLEEDIAALEARMAAIRPTGLEFPQQEILRAYAVQLHLKQLARLLESSRMEASA
jgi:uncharacterized membrane protein YccC